MARWILILMLVLMAVTIRAQAPDCSQRLLQANDEFTAGRFYGIPGLLAECLENLSSEEKVRAYHLLAQTYLIIDDPVAAEDSYLRLLGADPEYVATLEKDPVDIVYLSSKFTAEPVFTPHFRAGGTYSFKRIIHEINSSPVEVPRDRNVSLGFLAGGGIDWNYNEKLSLCIEGNYAFRSYSYIERNINTRDERSEIERQSWVDIPVYIKYKDTKGRIRPFGYAGASLNLLFSSSVELNFINKTNNEGEVPTVGPNENITYKRNLINRSIVFGGGIYYKVGKNFLFADARYSLGLSNVVNLEKNYYDESSQVLSPLVTRYGWIGNAHRQDFISISVGYVRPIYNPRKLKRSRTKKLKTDE
ncbi:MAG: outer membrane beta-barrel protein [Cyclobacteriaceae bacterium]